ncbi:MAG: FAD-dependent oxidoreductase, partial [Planctomycetes bacterium]|nr:FAD-dependent oxidoreductase [Planctomycetota bacterium]
MKNNQVIIVGSGIAGLVAAHHLKKNNIDPIILESSSRVGGRMVTDASDDYIMDGGAQFLSSAYKILSGLIKEFGIEAEFVETSRTVGIVRNGKIRKFRYDKPQSLLFGGLLSFREWLSFGFGSFRLLKQTKNLPVNDYSKWKEFDDETTESWSNRYYGKSITDYFIEPLLGALFFQSPSNTSRALPIAINAFAAHKAKTMTLIGGIGRLPKLLAEGLDVRTS